ncbi:phage terminase large subunit [Alienimonas sp. DA493]|uniref:phage terminase large subunit n=1 Tax=Alienimonas sp. DA493 TaxID=3373605 RepID=UPI0037550C2B
MIAEPTKPGVAPVRQNSVERETADRDALLRAWEKLDAGGRERLLSALRVKARGYRSNDLLDAVRPHPHPKQRLFLSLNDREVLFGGSAGGGKSDAMLMAAIQYADVPGYAGLILRKTRTRLRLAGGLLPRSLEWFRPWIRRGEMSWNGSDNVLTFPAGGTLTFGYLDHEDRKYQYGSSEFQFIGWDEVTEFPESQYTYLLSRLRKPDAVETGNPLGDVPLRYRAATNPGGVGGEWVKQRYIPAEYHETPLDERNGRLWAKVGDCGLCGGSGRYDGGTCIACGGAGDVRRLFLPSTLKDNPTIDAPAYVASLADMHPVDRERLLNGDWAVSDRGGFFDESWFRYYDRRGEHFVRQTPQGDRVTPAEGVLRFATADTASKDHTTSDYTAMAAWAFDRRSGDLFLIDVRRDKFQVPDVAPEIAKFSRKNRCEFVIVEDASSGTGAIQSLRRTGRLTVKSYSPGMTSKQDRATVAAVRMEAGQIYVPADPPGWWGPWLTELLSFPAGEHDDQVDTLSMAAWYADRNGGKAEKGGPAFTVLDPGMAVAGGF